MLPARVQGQAYRVSDETLDVVTGTEKPLWEVAFLRYATVCKATTIEGSGGRVMPTLLRLGALRFLRFGSGPRIRR
jgi:hypothetical protein